MKHNFVVKIYIQAQRDFAGNVSIKPHVCDMSEYGYTPVKEIDVPFEVETPDDFDLTSTEVEQLKEEKKRIQADANLQITRIEERIQSLLCIEHK